MQPFFDPLHNLIKNQELWLMERTLSYAKAHGYTAYTSTLLEAWRVSICGLSSPLLAALEILPDIAPLEPGCNYREDPIAGFGVKEARQHRARGVTLELFLGLFKYYRQAYLDVVALGDFTQDQQQQFLILIHRFFDRIELGFCHEWMSLSEQQMLTELQTKNREVTNEKKGAFHLGDE